MNIEDVKRIFGEIPEAKSATSNPSGQIPKLPEAKNSSGILNVLGGLALLAGGVAIVFFIKEVLDRERV